MASAVYPWERPNDSFLHLQEDESGQLQDECALAGLNNNDEPAAPTAKRRMIRYLALIVDLSEGLADKDFRPSRLTVFGDTVEKFIAEFYDANPVSQLGIVITQDKKARRLTRISGSPASHIKAFRAALEIKGQPSLQNSLTVAKKMLEQTPDYGSREILVLYGSIHTCDPGNVHRTIDELKERGIRASVVGVGAEMYVGRVLASKTTGSYDIAVDVPHFKMHVSRHILPPPLSQKHQPAHIATAHAIEMGFPRYLQRNSVALATSSNEFTNAGYSCPRCNSILTELPVDCPVCGLPNVTSSALARSFHHLFPVPAYVWMGKGLGACNIRPCVNCSGCFKWIDADEERFHPQNTKEIYCADCNSCIHDCIHNSLQCPDTEMAVNR